MNSTSRGRRFVSGAAESPARAMTGPDVAGRPSSAATICASVVLPSPGGVKRVVHRLAAVGGGGDKGLGLAVRRPADEFGKPRSRPVGAFRRFAADQPSSCCVI